MPAIWRKETSSYWKGMICEAVALVAWMAIV